MWGMIRLIEGPPGCGKTESDTIKINLISRWSHDKLSALRVWEELEEPLEKDLTETLKIIRACILSGSEYDNFRSSVSSREADLQETKATLQSTAKSDSFGAQRQGRSTP